MARGDVERGIKNELDNLGNGVYEKRRGFWYGPCKLEFPLPSCDEHWAGAKL